MQLVAPETGRDWQLNANKVHEGVARIRTLFGVRNSCISISNSHLTLLLRAVHSWSTIPKLCIIFLLKTRISLKNGQLLLRKSLHFNTHTSGNWTLIHTFARTNALLFGDGLVATIGDQHKKQRKMLTPAFSIKHLRGMTPLFVSIAREVCALNLEKIVVINRLEA